MELNATRFIENPTWTRLEHEQKGRFYRTGDPVRYCPDGSLLSDGKTRK